MCFKGGDVHQPGGGEGEDSWGTEAVAGGRLGPHHTAEAGESWSKSKVLWK